MMDNASDNDTCMENLADNFSFLAKTRRLRCAGHINNLVAKAFMYGKKLSSFEDSLASSDDVQKLVLWRKRGPVGKLHNLCVHINRTPQRRELFKSKQVEASEEGGPEKIYEAICDGGIRWNSGKYMIARAIKLRNAFDLYTMEQGQREKNERKNEDEKKSILKDTLTADDWADLSQFLEVLQCFEEITQRLEGNANTGSHGALWEVITSMDFLLEKLEGYRERLQLNQEDHIDPDLLDKEEDTSISSDSKEHFKTSINQAWAVLNKYYALTDETPAYRAAVILHPQFKMGYFKKTWAFKPSWIAGAEQAVRTLWKEYKDTYQPTVTVTSSKRKREQSEIDRFLDFDDEDQAAGDELDRYLSMPREKNSNPIQWWRTHRESYPVLSRLAFDLLSVPAMSSECERVFSKAGRVATDDRNRITAATLQEGECLKSWHSSGIIKIAAEGLEELQDII